MVVLGSLIHKDHIVGHQRSIRFQYTKYFLYFMIVITIHVNSGYVLRITNMKESGVCYVMSANGL